MVKSFQNENYELRYWKKEKKHLWPLFSLFNKIFSVNSTNISSDLCSFRFSIKGILKSSVLPTFFILTNFLIGFIESQNFFIELKYAPKSRGIRSISCEKRKKNSYLVRRAVIWWKYLLSVQNLRYIYTKWNLIPLGITYTNNIVQFKLRLKA